MEVKVEVKMDITPSLIFLYSLFTSIVFTPPLLSLHRLAFVQHEVLNFPFYFPFYFLILILLPILPFYPFTFLPFIIITTAFPRGISVTSPHITRACSASPVVCSTKWVSRLLFTRIYRLRSPFTARHVASWRPFRPPPFRLA